MSCFRIRACEECPYATTCGVERSRWEHAQQGHEHSEEALDALAPREADIQVRKRILKVKTERATHTAALFLRLSLLCSCSACTLSISPTNFLVMIILPLFCVKSIPVWSRIFKSYARRPGAMCGTTRAVGIAIPRSSASSVSSTTAARQDGDRPARMCATAEDGGGIHAGSPQELARAATLEKYGAMDSSSRASTPVGDQDVLNIKREGGECARASRLDMGMFAWRTSSA